MSCTSCGVRKGPGTYHLEYGYSCMGYEIAGGLGVKMADPSREVIVMVGDGSYLMMNSEIATSVAMGLKLTIVLLDNGGFGCISRLQEATGGAPFNNLVPHGVDLRAHAAAMGADRGNRNRSGEPGGGRASLGIQRAHHRHCDRNRSDARHSRPGAIGGMSPCRKSRNAPRSEAARAAYQAALGATAMTVRLGTNPIAWSNDDLRELGEATPLETCLFEARAAGFVGIELGHKFPREPNALRDVLARHDLALVSGWYSARLLERSSVAEMIAMRPHLELLLALGCQGPDLGRNVKRDPR